MLTLTLVVTEDVGVHTVSLHFNFCTEFLTYLPFQSGSVSLIVLNLQVVYLFASNNNGRATGDVMVVTMTNGRAAAVERMIMTMVKRKGK